MSDIPIIFSAPMVRALLADQKTMTRRLALRKCPGRKGNPCSRCNDTGFVATPWQRVKPGDRLWVRENLCQRQGEFLGIKQNVIDARYAADEAEVLNEHGFNLLPWWKGDAGLPSIHMPRWASRLTLIVTATKIQPLRSMSDADIMAEGVCAFTSGPTSMFGIKVEGGYSHPGLTPRETFSNLWCDLHGPSAWNDNPEVVAISFRVVKANIDTPDARAAA